MNQVFRNGRPVVGVGDRFQDSRRPAPPTFPPIRRPAPPRLASPATRAHETVVARAWRPEWGGRPAGFGAARWRPEWGARPAWFGARQWRREWGAQPAWWGAHIAVQQDAPPDDQDDDTQSTTPADAATPAPSTPSTPPSGAPAPPSTSPTTAAPDAGPAPDGHHAKRGLSTLAKVGIGVGALAVVGGTIAVLAAASGGKKKTAQPAVSEARLPRLIDPARNGLHIRQHSSGVYQVYRGRFTPYSKPVFTSHDLTKARDYVNSHGR